MLLRGPRLTICRGKICAFHIFWFLMGWGGAKNVLLLHSHRRIMLRMMGWGGVGLTTCFFSIPTDSCLSSVATPTSCCVTSSWTCFYGVTSSWTLLLRCNFFLKLDAVASTQCVKFCREGKKCNIYWRHRPQMNKTQWNCIDLAATLTSSECHFDATYEPWT